MLDQRATTFLPERMSVKPQLGRETSDSTSQTEAAGVIEDKAFKTKHRATCGISTLLSSENRIRLCPCKGTHPTCSLGRQCQLQIHSSVPEADRALAGLDSFMGALVDLLEFLLLSCLCILAPQAVNTGSYGCVCWGGGGVSR